MNIHVCSFASASFLPQQLKQAQQLALVGFDSSRTYLCSPDDLGQDFYAAIPFASEANRFGYFSFKPYFLAGCLASIPEDDALFYLDVNDCPLTGIVDYVENVLAQDAGLNILAAATNYRNSRHSSFFHRRRSPLPLRMLSALFCQPEAGALVVRNCPESRGLMNVWYELTSLHAHALAGNDDQGSRHDQETLFMLSTLNRTIRFESWYAYKATGAGLRRYIKWEHFRNA